MGLPRVQWWRIRLPMQEMQETGDPSLGREDPLEKEMATCSSILAWETPWAEKPGELQTIESQRVRHNLATEHVHSEKEYLFYFLLLLLLFVCFCFCFFFARKTRGKTVPNSGVKNAFQICLLFNEESHWMFWSDSTENSFFLCQLNINSLLKYGPCQT